MLKSLIENLRAMGCSPEIVDGDTVKVNAPPVDKKVIGYTIKSSSPEGVYYLVNGWYKHFAFWIRKKDYSYNVEYHLKLITFKTIGSAKTSLTKLLKIMPDYSGDVFELCEIYNNGVICPVRKAATV